MKFFSISYVTMKWWIGTNHRNGNYEIISNFIRNYEIAEDDVVFDHPFVLVLLICWLTHIIKTNVYIIECIISCLHIAR